MITRLDLNPSMQMNQVKANSKLKGKLNFIVKWSERQYGDSIGFSWHQIPPWKQKGQLSSKTKNPQTTFTVKLELKPLWQTPNYRRAQHWQTSEQENPQSTRCSLMARWAVGTRWGPSSPTVGGSKGATVSPVMNDQTVQPEPPLDTGLHTEEKLCSQSRTGRGQQRQGVITCRWK